MSDLGLRINELREGVKMSKKDLGVIAGLSGQGIADIEKGVSKDPGSIAMLKIADHFQVNLIWLLTGQLPKEKSELENTLPIKQNREEDRVILIVPETTDTVTVPMIDQKAAANYLSGHTSEGYYNELSPTVLPKYMASGGTHFWLQVKGDSMESTYYDGDWLLCEKIPTQNWVGLKDFDVCVVVSNERGVQVKRIKNRLKKGFIRCRSDNRAHKPYSIIYDDLLEIWRVKWHLTNYMPNRNEELFNKVDFMEENLEDLRSLTENLIKELDTVKKQLPK